MVRSTLLAVALVPLAYAAPEGADIFGRAACNRDLCLRAVAASAAAPGTASASADCTKYLQKTVSLCPTTTTTTVTASAGAGAGSKKRNNKRNVVQQLDARTVAASCTTASTYSISAVPSYISAPCSASGTSSLVRYSSACSCNGIKSISTVTLPQATVTATTTTTTTSAAAAPTNIINEPFRFYFDDNTHAYGSRIAIDYNNPDPSKRGNLRDLEDNGGELLSFLNNGPSNYVTSAYDTTLYLIQDPVSKVVTITGTVNSPGRVQCVGVPYPGDAANWYKLYCNAGTDNTFFACRTSSTVQTVYVTDGSVPPGFQASDCQVVGLRAPVPG